MKAYIRALRLPFISASILPFTFGSFAAGGRFEMIGFLLGLVAVVSVHLGSNLMNDYADSQSGVDWYDRRYYNFFGGSKLIQEGVFSESFYLRLAAAHFTVALGAVIGLAFVLRRPSVIGYAAVIAFLGIAYSHRPLKLSYRELGEVVIFLLFGPALVMGGYFIQTGIFPDARSFLLSLPFGFLTTGILFANEVPDYEQDTQSGKVTWVSWFGPERSYVLYAVLMLCAAASVIANIFAGYLSGISWCALAVLVPAFRAASVLKRHFSDKLKLKESSRLTIMAQTIASLVLMIDAFL